jgi:hypothetical protein
MHLFDTDIDRSDTGPAKHGEPRFPYLNRTGRPEAAQVRDLLETWFAGYPPTGQVEIRARLRSPDIVHHHAAFFELYLHELLRVLGYKIELHPKIEGTDRRPDFYVSRSETDAFYLEAIVATDQSAAEMAKEARLNQVYDALNTVNSPNFFIGVDTPEGPPSPPPGKMLRRAVEGFVKDLDPDALAEAFQQHGFDALPRGKFEHDGWVIEFFPMPKSPAARGDPGIRPLGMMGSMEARMVDSRAALRDAVEKKASRYGELGRPYIIAVNAVTQHLDLIDVMEALFGKEAFIFRPGPDGQTSEPEMRRNPDGAWLGPRGPTNTRVTAVLVASSLVSWSVAAYSPSVYHNPWATSPCTEALMELPSYHPAGDRMELREGRSFRELVGLPEGWPMAPASA